MLFDSQLLRPQLMGDVGSNINGAALVTVPRFSAVHGFLLHTHSVDWVSVRLRLLRYA